MNSYNSLMKQEEEKKDEASCSECKYIFLAAFAALLSFFVVTYLLRGDQFTTSVPSQNTGVTSTGTAR